MISSPDQLEVLNFNDGDILFREGDNSFHFFIIQKGEVEIFKNGPDGKEIKLATLGEGQAFGEFAMIAKQPRSASARAKGEVSATLISEEGYYVLLQDLPEWAIAMMESLVQRLIDTDNVLQEYVDKNDELLSVMETLRTGTKSF